MTPGQSSKLEEIEGMVNGVYFTTYIRELTKIRRRFNLRISGSRLVKVAQNNKETRTEQILSELVTSSENPLQRTASNGVLPLSTRLCESLKLGGNRLKLLSTLQ